MPFGSVQDVKEKTLEMLKISKEYGKLVIAPTHLLEPEVPLENIEMFINIVKEFNKNYNK
jgi:uroporphyrinogen decarboxylase